MNKLGKPRGPLWSDLIGLCVGSLGANKLRSALTILGVAIGVFSVVGVMTALAAIRHSIDTSLNVFGANVLQITRDNPIQLRGPGGWMRGGRREPVTPRQAEEFKRAMDELGIPTTLSARDSRERARYGETRTSPIVEIVGTNENFLLTNNYELDYGRNLSMTDLEFRLPVVVIGYDIRDELFPREDPLGKVISLDGEWYTVVGVLKERGELFGRSLDTVALVPHTKFVANNWHRRRSMDIAIQAESVEALGATEDMAIGNMRIARELQPEEENDFDITSNQALQASFAEVAVLVEIGGLLISGIALVCAGIGIMNIMLVSVTERTREIGVRKALGARKKSVLSQFLLEAVFLSEIGAVGGILLGMIVGNAVAAQFNAEIIVPWFWIGMAVAICTAIGIGFGFAPALRAANLKPVDALRSE